MSPTVTVVDYGLGNLHSVEKALRHEGAVAERTGDPDRIARAEWLILPGVGAFRDGMAGLRERGLVEPIHAFVKTGRPLLGICLGMQLFLSESEEFGRHTGLGLIRGKVVEIPRARGRKVPHVGWTEIVPGTEAGWAHSPLAPLAPGTMVYFVHSFAAEPEDPAARLADADHVGHRISAAIRRENVIGCQFHPEKSGSAGLQIIRQFLRST